MVRMGGATVLKVRGTILRAERAKKIFDPKFLACGGGGQNIA